MMNLIKRILTGAIYIALIVLAILLLDNSPVMYLLVFSLFIVLGIGEMITMAKDDATQSWLVNVIDMFGGVGLWGFISIITARQCNRAPCGCCRWSATSC